MKRINTIIESNTQPRGNNTLWIKTKEGGGKELKLGNDTIGSGPMQNVGGSSVNVTYQAIRESAEALGWGSIVNAILSSDVFNNGVVDITAYKTANSLMEAISSFANAIKDTIGPEAIYNLPYNWDDEDEIGTHDKCFGIPVTFVGIHHLSEKGLEDTRVDSNTGKIVIERDGNRDDVCITFKFFFNAGTDLSEYSLSSDGRKNKNNFTFESQGIA